MTSTATELLRDPLFQLNALLWLAQPLPAPSEISALLWRQGFTVYAISPPLGLPPDLRLAAQGARITMQESVSPDVVLAQETENKFAFMECKATSFGTASSTANQARALLTVAGPRAGEVLGLLPSQVSHSLLAFVMPEDQREPMTKTLAALSNELSENQLSPAPFFVVGLATTETDIGIQINDIGSSFFGLPAGLNPFMRREPDTDPRPLYFVPYDPDVLQSDEESKLCKRILFERIQSTVVAAAGSAIPPSDIALQSEEILNDAMFGMYRHWENRASKKHMRGLYNDFIGHLSQAVNKQVPEAMVFVARQGWKIRLRGQEHQEKVTDALTRFSCETLDLRAEPQPDLHDLLEVDGPAL